MADSSVLLEVIVEGKNIKVVQRNVEELASSVNKASKAEEKSTKQKKKSKNATEELNSETRNYNRGQKGVAGATANGTKAFSKQRDLIGGGSSGLVGAYATLAANLFAATALFGALRSAAQVETLVEGAEALGAASGRNIPLLAESLKEATSNAISLDQALRTASFATSSGFSATQIESLAEVGKKAAIALGRDVGDAVDRLTRGVAKLEPEILDELGIIVRLDDATESYAAQIGKTVSQLTAFERQQGFANATIEQGLDKFSNIDTDPNPYDQLSASLRDLANAGLALINTVLGPLVGFFAQNKAALLGLIIVLTQGIVRQALPIFSQFASKARDAATAVAESVGKATKAQQEQFKASKKSLMGVAKGLDDLGDEYKTMFSYVKSYDALIDKEKELTKEINKREGALKRSKKAETIEKRTAELDRLKEAQRRVNVEIGKQKAPDLDVATANKLKQIAQSKVDLFESLDDDPSIDNFKNKFKEARNIGEEYSTTMGKAGKFQLKFLEKLPLIGGKLGFVNKAFASGAGFVARWGLSTQVALRGVTYAIPIIGKIILGLTIFIAVLKKAINVISDFLPEQSNLSKASDKIRASTETLRTTTEAYGDTLVKISAEESLYKTTLEALTDVKDRAAESDKAREARLVAEITLIKGQGTSIQASIAAYKEYSKELAIANESSGFLTRKLRGLADWAGKVGFEFSRMGKLIKLEIAGALSSVSLALVEFVESGKLGSGIVAELFGIGESEIASTKEEARLLEEQLARTFNAPQASVLINNLDGKLSALFIETIEGSEEAAEAITKKLLGAGASVDAGAISAKIQDIFDTGNVEGLDPKLLDEYNKIAGAGGLLDTEAEKRAFILKLLDKGTENLIKQSTQISTIESAVDGATESLSNYITGLSKSKSSVGGVLEQMEKLTLETENSVIKGELLEQLLKKLPNGFKGILEALDTQNGDLAEGLKIYQGMLKNLQEIELSEKRITNLNKMKISVLKEAGKLNKAALQNTLDAELAIINLNKRKKDQQIELLELEVTRQRLAFEAAQTKAAEDGKELKVPQALLQVESDLTNLRAESSELGRQILDNTTAQKNIQLITYDIQKEQAKLDKERADITEKQLVTSQKLANALSGRGFKLTRKEELEQIERQGNLAIEAATTEKTIAEARLGIEREILKAKLEAANATIKSFNLQNPNDQVALIDDTGILTDFDANTTRVLEGFQNKIDAAKTNLQGSLLEAAFGGMQGQAGENPATAAFDQMQGALTAYRVSLANLGEDATPFDVLKLQFAGVRDALAPSLDALRSLGPDGVLLATVSEGVISMGENFSVLGQKMEEGGDKYEHMASKIAAVGGIINSVGQIAAAASQQRIAGIDKEIAAEKKRDGKSKESLARIQQLEKKKEAAKKKQFEMDKKMQMANVVISTASAIMGVWSGVKDPYVGPISAGAMTAIIAGLGAAQLAMIASTSYQGGGGSIAGASTPTSISAGQRKSSVDIAKSQSSVGELAYMRGAEGIGGPENFKPAMMGAKYRAMGGPTTGYVVGEQGPELFVPETPGTIVPNNTQPEMQQPLNVNFSINTIDSSGVEDVLVKQQGNIIGMVRAAANSYGQGFLEEVDTSSFTQTAGGATRY